MRVLDHGYIELVETWGSDERIVEAARMSTGKGFLGWGPHGLIKGEREELACDDAWNWEREGKSTRWESIGENDDGTPRIYEDVKAGDEKLLRYLYENRHDTPFEMAGMIVEVQAPIIVFREWHRHRVPWSYNEASARYAPLPALDYLPTPGRLMVGGGHLTKQAGVHGGQVLGEGNAAAWLGALEKWQGEGERLYQLGLQMGVPKELARGAMTVFRFSKMRASANLRGWMHFLALRSALNAQQEIRVYAEAAATLLREAFPRSMVLFDGDKR